MKRLFAGTLALMMLFAMTGCKANAQSLVVEKPAETEVEEAAAETLGGWTAAEDTALTDDQRSLFEKALEGLVGVDYEPVAVLGSQVVAGMNYKILCKATVVSPEAKTGYAHVTIYSALDGHAEVLDITDVAL